MSSDEDRTLEDERPLQLGGMALQNGLFLHGPTSWSAAVRAEDGHIRVASGVKRTAPKRLVRVPLARGVVRVGEMMALMPQVRRALPDARMPYADARVGVAAAASAAVVATLRRSPRVSPLRAELIAALAGVVPSAIALRSRSLAQYHGAEHKTIGGYETGGPAEEASKEHERCGSHLIGPLVLATTAAQLIASRAPEDKRGAARATGSLAAVGVAVEVFAWMDRHRSHPLSKALARPGHLLQSAASTAEPTSEQLEVAERALDELLRREGAPRRD
jgi:uncharacterized protein YqhQ